MVYIYEGEASIGDQDFLLRKTNLVRLSKEGELVINGAGETKVLVITGKPINEPIVQHGPFVMNSVEEIQTAVRQYSDGTFV